MEHSSSVCFCCLQEESVSFPWAGHLFVPGIGQLGLGAESDQKC